MKKILLLLLLLLLLIFTALFLVACAPQNSAVETFAAQSITLSDETSEDIAPPEPEVFTLKFSASGDNLIHTGIYLQAAQNAGHNGYDFSFCYVNMLDYLSGFDINWINQETLVNDELAPSSYPMFSTPGEMGHNLYDAGFSVFSLSNNHTYDKGAQGLSATMDFWNNKMPKDTYTCGLFASEDDYYDAITYQTKNGITIAYLAYTEMTNGLPRPQNAPYHVILTSQTDIVQKQIETAAQNADIVVVSNHWGVENSHSYTEAQQILAQQMADWGADLIIGTHPHVVQDAEWLKAADGRDVFVAYSLGNYISLQATADTMIGAVLECEFEKTLTHDGHSTAAVKNARLRPIVTHYDPGYKNAQVFLFENYTAELAAAHGIRSRYSVFSMEYIEGVLREHISADLLAI